MVRTGKPRYGTAWTWTTCRTHRTLLLLITLSCNLLLVSHRLLARHNIYLQRLILSNRLYLRLRLLLGLCLNGRSCGLTIARSYITIQILTLGCGLIRERDSSIYTCFQHTKTAQQTLARTLQTEVHLKDKTVDGCCSLQLRHAIGDEQRTQHAIIALDKIRE